MTTAQLYTRRQRTNYTHARVNAITDHITFQVWGVGPQIQAVRCNQRRSTAMPKLLRLCPIRQFLVSNPDYLVLERLPTPNQLGLPIFQQLAPCVFLLSTHVQSGPLDPEHKLTNSPQSDSQHHPLVLLSANSRQSSTQLGRREDSCLQSSL